MKWCMMILGAGLLLGADHPVDEKAKLKGGRFMTAYTADGSVFGVAPDPKPDLVFEEVKFLDVDDFPMGTYKVDSTKDPKRIDLRYEEGYDKGTVLYGIYKLDGDTLTICASESADSRPKDFTSKTGSKRELRVYKRKPDQ